jgi:uncharacterized membrane protein YraQ (UPF0718 family)
MVHCVIVSGVANVLVLQSWFKSWLGHECVFAFVYIAASCIVVLYLCEPEITDSSVSWWSSYFNIIDIQFEV